jgi:UDP-N-acetylmuramoyl-L-alanyl-D-glutamate--2,6-diaminopimelate ligase
MSERGLVELLGDLARHDRTAPVPSVVGEPAGVAISDVTHDSRAVQPGAVFCAVRGLTSDGHQFVHEAVDAGAAAVLVDHEIAGIKAVQLVVSDVRVAMGHVAAAFHGYPGSKLRLIGITGTNGKTSTAHLIDAVIAETGERSAVLGTLTQTRTTPEATDLQRRLAELVDAGVRTVTMEVTSHALALDRVASLLFDIAVFTNLTQDHLDFHATMENYFRAKARLFEPQRARHAVVNGDDPYGRLLNDAPMIPTVRYSLDQADRLRFDARGSSFVWHNTPIRLRLGGTFSVSNALAAATACAELNIPIDTIAAGLAGVYVPGRFEPVDEGQDYTVIVDYAHTPDALERGLQAARGITAPGGRLIAVFGCGGDRDRTKRPIMGRLATDLADMAIATSDNPRSEDPAAILQEVVSGVVRPSVLRVEVNRRTAILEAISSAKPGDVVLIAGKGHETGQTIGDVVHPFDDREVARAAIAAGQR